MSESSRRWALVGLSGLAFALRLIGLDAQSLWRDEVDAIRFANRPWGDLLRAFVTPGENGPLYYLLLQPWLRLAGESEFALRFFSVVFGVLAVLLVYRLSRRLFSSRPVAALLAALLAVASPYLVWYSQEGKMYALIVTLVLLSMDRYLAAVGQGGWPRWLIYVLVTSAAFYVHLIAALVVPAQAIVFFVLSKQVRRTRWKPWLVSLAVLTVPYLPLLIWQLPLLLQHADTGYRFVPLHEMLFSLLGSYSLGVVQRATGWTMVLFVGLLLAAALSGRGRESPLAPLPVLACWLLLPVVGLFLITLRRPLYTARYLIFVLPAYLLLLVAGLVAMARRSRLLAGLLLVALLALDARGLWLQATTPVKTDFRAATRYVSRRLNPGDLILFQIPYGRYSFEYYSHSGRPRLVAQPGCGQYRVFLPWVAGAGAEPYRWAEGLYTNGGMAPAEVDRRMADIIGGSRVVWLVATEVSMWDERGLVQAWLDDHAVLTDEAQFVRVTVYRYQWP